MFGIVFKLFAIAICIIVVIYTAAGAFRKARRLDARIKEFKEEQERLAKQSGPINPYAALGELYSDESTPADRKAKSASPKQRR